jgi:histidyl-tRNA synthetase
MLGAAEIQPCKAVRCNGGWRSLKALRLEQHFCININTLVVLDASQKFINLAIDANIQQHLVRAILQWSV